MTRFELVIAGGGLTAARAIKSYREAGGGGPIALLSKESVLPYHRPALSKRYLRGETGAPFAEDEAFYRDHDVEVLLKTAVTAVDLGARTVTTDSGEFVYGKLHWPPARRHDGSRCPARTSPASTRCVRSKTPTRSARRPVPPSAPSSSEVGSLAWR